MRYLLQSLSLSFLFATCAALALAQRQNLTDAQRMDLAGPVKSVSVTEVRTGVAWQQPGGPTLVYPLMCRECEFDPDGNQTKSGQIFNGSFLGESIRLVRDANGHVVERFVEDASTGERVRHEVVGPFGETEKSIYHDGKLKSHGILRYDSYGHLIDWLTLDGEGNQEAHMIVNTDKDGNDTETWSWGKEGQLVYHLRQTYDPKSKIEHFTIFNEFGGVKLTWTVISGKLDSFWEPPDSPSQFGDNFTEDAGNNTRENYACHSDGTCELSRIHYEFLDPKGRNPRSAEWRDAEGNLRYAAYYEYEIDNFRNWTHRQIWVWSQALGERKLYETDARSISYWPQ